MMQRFEMVRYYLKDLGLSGRTSDMAFLRDVVAHHVATFAFSSVGCQLHEDLPL
ncbi:MAG: hypothetical protein JRJ68_12000, partial [Deltaproteobacteria bacterium]|nr:hypothetical protein [Deltaproteobacteria bacterium]